MADYMIDLRRLMEQKTLDEECQVTISDVSRGTGLSRLTIQKLLADGRSWSRGSLNCICEYFNRPANEVLYDDEQRR